MFIPDIIAAMIEERNRLDIVISVLRGINGKSGSGTGVFHTPYSSRITKPSPQTWTPAKRKAASERMRRYWAKRKKTVMAKKS
jgi:hypothetical protein